MLDREGRKIDYLRISVTDRCNLRCFYCMPAEGVPCLRHDEILSYEEILLLASAFARVGIRKIKLTGGEPLVRRDLDRLVAGLKSIDGIECVTLTTNGVLLREQLPGLLKAGLDGVNVSLDTLREDTFATITRRGGVDGVLDGLHAALEADGLNVKLNCVPCGLNREELPALAALAKDDRLAVRFIELMPIGLGRELEPVSEAEVRGLLETAYGPMKPTEEVLGNGPCRYFTLEGFQGRIGFISAVSHKFCSECNRVRLTSSGYLKTCLQYDIGRDLRPLLSGSREDLVEAIRQTIEQKPLCHHFGEETQSGHLESHRMNAIGG